MIEKYFGNYKIVLGFWIAFLLYGLVLFNLGAYPRLKDLARGMELPEEIYGPNLDYQTLFLERIGSANIGLYTQFQLFDLINALLLGLVFAATIYLILTHLKAPRALFAVAVIPVFTSILDLAENLVMLLNISNFPKLNDDLSWFYSAFNQGKFLTGTASFFVLLICVVILIVSVATRRIGK